MTGEPLSSRETARRTMIMEAAFGTFANYGFKRTSMDDIAKAAGISRPALYQTFANKNDIFRALIEDWIDKTDQEAAECLAEDMPIKKRLHQLLDILVLQPHRTMEKMPHGEEVTGLKSEIAPDLFDKMDARNRRLFQTALTDDPTIDNALALPLAQTISLAISGIKARMITPAEMEAELEAVVRVVIALTHPADAA